MDYKNCIGNLDNWYNIHVVFINGGIKSHSMSHVVKKSAYLYWQENKDLCDFIIIPERRCMGDQSSS